MRFGFGFGLFCLVSLLVLFLSFGSVGVEARGLVPVDARPSRYKGGSSTRERTCHRQRCERCERCERMRVIVRGRSVL